MNLKEAVETSQTIYHGHILQLEKQRVKTPSGRIASREIIHHHPAVALLMITADQKMILIKQWRAALQKATLEIPAGKVDERDQGNLIHAAHREMNEETRLQATSLKKIVTLYSSPGFTDEQITLFKATGLSSVREKLPQDQDENLQIIQVDRDQAFQMVRNGEIDDMKTVTAIYYWMGQEDC
ncbi:NUDIX hydrolase [uncultured Limosilactobacillus sp.]|uniref:NUDIX hydrolase n=1 Tax=uncultured Limosilactobacillus sp. TaxID=2837629 RepID=UPI0025F97482|nr:NUDIX hydrolase [uncultured Limosilactobacillus sp.]